MIAQGRLPGWGRGVWVAYSSRSDATSSLQSNLCQSMLPYVSLSVQFLRHDKQTNSLACTTIRKADADNSTAAASKVSGSCSVVTWIVIHMLYIWLLWSKTQHMDDDPCDWCNGNVSFHHNVSDFLHYSPLKHAAPNCPALPAGPSDSQPLAPANQQAGVPPSSSSPCEGGQVDMACIAVKAVESALLPSLAATTLSGESREGWVGLVRWGGGGSQLQ